jgi:hypothetical protein
MTFGPNSLEQLRAVFDEGRIGFMLIGTPGLENPSGDQHSMAGQISGTRTGLCHRSLLTDAEIRPN